MKLNWEFTKQSKSNKPKLKIQTNWFQRSMCLKHKDVKVGLRIPAVSRDTVYISTVHIGTTDDDQLTPWACGRLHTPCSAGRPACRSPWRGCCLHACLSLLCTTWLLLSGSLSLSLILKLLTLDSLPCFLSYLFPNRRFTHGLTVHWHHCSEPASDLPVTAPSGEARLPGDGWDPAYSLWAVCCPDICVLTSERFSSTWRSCFRPSHLYDVRNHLKLCCVWTHLNTHKLYINTFSLKKRKYCKRGDNLLLAATHNLGSFFRPQSYRPPRFGVHHSRCFIPWGITCICLKRNSICDVFLKHNLYPTVCSVLQSALPTLVLFRMSVYSLHRFDNLSCPSAQVYPYLLCHPLTHEHSGCFQSLFCKHSDHTHRWPWGSVILEDEL